MENKEIDNPIDNSNNNQAGIPNPNGAGNGNPNGEEALNKGNSSPDENLDLIEKDKKIESLEEQLKGSRESIPSKEEPARARNKDDRIDALLNKDEVERYLAGEKIDPNSFELKNQMVDLVSEGMSPKNAHAVCVGRQEIEKSNVDPADPTGKPDNGDRQDNNPTPASEKTVEELRAEAEKSMSGN